MCLTWKKWMKTAMLILPRPTEEGYLGNRGVVDKPHVLGLFKYPEGHVNVQMLGAKNRTARRMGIYVERCSLHGKVYPYVQSVLYYNTDLLR